jgi:hypothetical protein
MARKKKNIVSENVNNVIIIDGVEYTVDELKEVIKSINIKKNPLQLFEEDLPVIKERFATFLDVDSIKILSATEHNGIHYALVSDTEKILVLKRYQNGYYGLVKGVYQTKMFFNLLKGLAK